MARFFATARAEILQTNEGLSPLIFFGCARHGVLRESATSLAVVGHAGDLEGQVLYPIAPGESAARGGSRIERFPLAAGLLSIAAGY
jgi:hypothetical protein